MLFPVPGELFPMIFSWLTSHSGHLFREDFAKQSCNTLPHKPILILFDALITIRYILIYLFIAFFPAAAAAKSLHSCLTLCDPNPIDGSPPGSPIPGILQARTLEWVAISFSSLSPYDNASSMRAETSYVLFTLCLEY